MGASPSSAEPPLVPEVLPSVGPSAAEGCHTMTPLLYPGTLFYPSSTHYQRSFTLSGFCPTGKGSQISLLSHTFQRSKPTNEAANTATQNMQAPVFRLSAHTGRWPGAEIGGGRAGPSYLGQTGLCCQHQQQQ